MAPCMVVESRSILGGCGPTMSAHVLVILHAVMYVLNVNAHAALLWNTTTLVDTSDEPRTTLSGLWQKRPTPAHWNRP